MAKKVVIEKESDHYKNNDSWNFRKGKLHLRVRKESGSCTKTLTDKVAYRLHNRIQPGQLELRLISNMGAHLSLNEKFIVQKIFH
jgi:IS5 family transposase